MEKGIIKLLVLIFLFSINIFAYEAICTLSMGVKMKITVANKILKEYNLNTGEVIGQKKYLGKTKQGYYVYGEDPKDFLADIYLSSFYNDGSFKLFRIGNYDNKVQWNGECIKK